MVSEVFMPHWKDEEKCYEDEKIESTDRNGKKVISAWTRDKPVSQIIYENWLEKAMNPDTKEYYPKRDKDGKTPIKGTGARYVVKEIILIIIIKIILKRKDKSEWLCSLGRLEGYYAFGNKLIRAINCPEVWTTTLFEHKQQYDPKTNSLKMQTFGIAGSETVYEMPFNEKNLKRLFDQRINDDQVNFVDRSEVGSDKPVEVKKEPNINDTFKRFLKDFDYLYNGDYISPQQKAELRQQAIDMGAIPPSTPLVPQTTAPPKGTYS